MKSTDFTKAVNMALDNQIKVIFVHDLDMDFPKYGTIGSLSLRIRALFKSIAVPYLREYADTCWDKISDKVFDNVKVTQR